MAVPQLRAVGAELDTARARVRRIADAVGLRDHTFEIELWPLPDGVRATCICEENRAWSKIRLSEEFFDLTDEEQIGALIHEVLHPLFHRLMVHVTDLRRELGRSHYETLARVFERDLESVVDTLTSALLPLLPTVE